MGKKSINFVLTLLTVIAVSKVIHKTVSKSNLQLQQAAPEDYNDIVQSIVLGTSGKQFPTDGAYPSNPTQFIQATQGSIDAFKDSQGQEELKLDAMKAGDFFYCSQAVHLAFIMTFQILAEQKVIEPLGAELIRRLTFTGDATDVINGVYDGQEVYGRFNSGGNGVSILWQKLDLGRCTNEMKDVKPGDMGKLFWGDKVGKGEHGHVVIFQEVKENGDLCIWSCSQKDKDFKGGYGIKCYPQDKAKRWAFCRLERPQNIKNWLDYPTPL